MTVLKKNESYSLCLNNIGVSKIKISFYMDLEKINQQSADIDVVSFLLDKNDKIPNEGFFVFYNNLKSIDNSVIHNGDIITRDDDLASFSINLNLVDENISKIIFILSINNFNDGFSFNNVLNSRIELFNEEDNLQICEYQVLNENSNFNTMHLGSLIKKNKEWIFEAHESKSNMGLIGAVDIYN
jgi:tellurium resistance protein TerD